MEVQQLCILKVVNLPKTLKWQFTIGLKLKDKGSVFKVVFNALRFCFSTHLPIRLSTRSTCLSTRSICLSTRGTRLAIRLSTRSTICQSFYN